MNRKSATFIASLALISAAAGIATFAATSSYKIIKKVAVPGTGGWDYVAVDPSARRVYVSHATQVEVLDADTNEIVGVIPNTPGVHGIAIALEAGRGYVNVHTKKNPAGEIRGQLGAAALTIS